MGDIPQPRRAGAQNYLMLRVQALGSPEIPRGCGPWVQKGESEGRGGAGLGRGKGFSWEDLGLCKRLRVRGSVLPKRTPRNISG